MKKRLIIIFFVIAFTIFFGFKFYVSSMSKPVNEDRDVYVITEISSGSSTQKIAEILTDKQLIKSEFIFKYLSRINKYDGKYKAGKYALSASMDINEIMDIIKGGNAIIDTVRFTVPEGYDIKRIAEHLEELQLVDKEKFLNEVSSGDFDFRFLEGIKKDNKTIEGFLFPDTYEIYIGASEHEIINKMLKRFDDLFIDEYYNRAEELGLSIKEIITLASIIEREAMIDSERPLVASVFYNRLDTNMALQSCATVQYILGEVKPRLSTEDTRIESPYNTYLHTGLPPGPIASPGIESIKASLYPTESKYIYFVAKGDGSHAFAKTYNEFLRYKRKYIK